MTREELYEQLMTGYAGDRLEEMGGIITQLRELDTNPPVNLEMYVDRSEYDAVVAERDGLRGESEGYRNERDALRQQYINTFFGRQEPEGQSVDVTTETEDAEPEEEKIEIEFGEPKRVSEDKPKEDEEETEIVFERH